MPSQRGNTKRAIAAFTTKKIMIHRGINRKFNPARASQTNILAIATIPTPCTHALPDSIGRSGDIHTSPNHVRLAKRPQAIASIRNCIYFHNLKPKKLKKSLRSKLFFNFFTLFWQESPDDAIDRYVAAPHSDRGTSQPVLDHHLDVHKHLFPPAERWQHSYFQRLHDNYWLG